MTLLTSRLLSQAGLVPHGFSTRLGGASTAYAKPGSTAGELNLGFTTSDARENVLANRATLLQAVSGSSTTPLVTLHQTHSAIIHGVSSADAGEEAALSGDGLMTDEPGLMLGVQTADCVPILLADRKSGAVAAFHAGWRGTVQRIVEQGAARLCSTFGAHPEDLVAAIGPSIGRCCYEVGSEVEEAFRSAFVYGDDLFSATGRSSLQAASRRKLDLHEANRRQLLDAGLSADSIEVLDYCTSCRTDLFFSYRAEKGFTGRMLAVIGRPKR